MKKIKVLLVIVALIAIVGIGWYFISISSVNNNNEENIEITIPLGTGTSQIAKILKENKLIKSELAFKVYVKLNGVSNFKAGVYNLKQNMNLKAITTTLQTGILYDPNQTNFTYLEGKNMRWLAKEIANKTNNTEEDVFNLLKDEDYINSLIEKYWFITDKIKDSDIYYSLEGYLFPDTYTLKNKDIKVEEIFEMMLNQMEKKLEKYKKSIEDSKYNVHQILTIASIIEMEAMSADSRKDVSSVIYNRLNSGMAIQSDVTAYYGIKVDVGERDLYEKEINTYNAYNTRGPNMQGKLPVGPICSVREASIEAAIFPNDTDYLFFVADKNGKLYFTKTDSEHEQIIKQLRNEGLWLEY